MFQRKSKASAEADELSPQNSSDISLHRPQTTAVTRFTDINELRSVQSTSSITTTTTTASDAPLRRRKLFKRFFSRDSAQLFALLLGMTWLLENALVSGVLRATIPSVEKQFGHTSTQSGLIMSMYEAATLVSATVITFWGYKGHRPRWIGGGNLVIVVGVFTYTLPYFINAISANDESLVSLNATHDAQICDRTETPLSCDSRDRPNSYVFFILGAVIMGLGTPAMFILGLPYVQESVSRKNFPVYTGLLYSTACFGPVIGFLMTSFFDKTYVMPNMQPPWMDETKSNWVGAWWINFLIVGAGFIPLSLPFFFFPPSIPLSRERRLQQLRVASSASMNASQTQTPPAVGVEVDTNVFVGNNCSETCKLMKELLSNLVWLTTAFGLVACVSMMTGLTTFISKYLTATYGFSVAQSTLYSAVVIIPPAAIGIILGGYLNKKFNFGLRQLSLSILSCGLVSFIFCISLIFIRCPGTEVIGVHRPYKGNPFTIQLNESTDFGEGIGFHLDNLVDKTCNANCNCDVTGYDPICGMDAQTYFSPCFAGCHEKIENASTGRAMFTRCDCIDSNKTQINISNIGTCQSCLFYTVMFFVVMFVMVFFLALAHNSVILIILECVPTDIRSFSFGINTLVLKLEMATPIIYGSLLDTQCLLWYSADRNYLNDFSCRTTQQGENCLVYDSHMLPAVMFGGTASLMTAALFCFLFAFIMIRRREATYCPDMAMRSPEEVIKEGVIKEGVIKEVIKEGERKF